MGSERAGDLVRDKAEEVVITELKPERWVFTFEPMPGDSPMRSRANKLLKYAKSVRLRCVSVTDQIPPTVTVVVIDPSKPDEPS